jgi:histidinol-phosphate aminotransferase
MGSRRQFIGTVGAGAAALAFKPLFARSAFESPQAASQTAVNINYNENPYGPSPKALQAMREAVNGTGRYYVDTYYDELRATLAKSHGVEADNILMGAGSTEILKICDDVFLGERPRVVVADPAYEAVLQYAVNTKAQPTAVPLTKDFRHDLVKMADVVTPQTGMVYICNPNNPTGTIVTKDEMQRFMSRVPDSVPVVVDEAYSHFANSSDFESAIRYVKEGRNVVIARTFSKAYGLAGMRIGYAIARKDIIAKLKPFGVDFAVSSIAAAAANGAFADNAYVDKIVKQIGTQRQQLYDEMKALKYEVIPSHANFVMINVRTPVPPIIAELAKRKVNVGREFPVMPNHLRVTIGTEDDMKKFFAAFRQVVRT